MTIPSPRIVGLAAAVGERLLADAGDADDRALRELRLHAERGRETIAHRARGRADQAAILSHAMKAMHPAGEVAGADGDDRVAGQVFAQPHDLLAEIDAARRQRRLLGPCEEVGMRRGALTLPRDIVRRLQKMLWAAKKRRRGVDAERRV